MSDLFLDHSYYTDQDFQNWKILKNCLPDSLFSSKMVEHPTANCHFMFLENYVLEFAHVINRDTSFHGLCFVSKTSLFDVEQEMPKGLREKYGIITKHKNRDWQKDLDEDGKLPELKKGDSRIRAGWEYLGPRETHIHPNLSLWAGRRTGDGYEPGSPTVKLDHGTLKLKEMYLHESIINDSFFQFLSKDVENVTFQRSEYVARPIEKLVIATSKDYFDLLELPSDNNRKCLKAIDDQQYDIVFELI